MDDRRAQFGEDTVSLFNQGLLGADEQVVYRARMHRWHFFMWSALTALSCIFIYLVVSNYLQPNPGNVQPGPGAVIVVCLPFLILIYFAVKYFLDFNISWIALTSGNRIIGKIPSGMLLPGYQRLDVPLGQIQEIKGKSLVYREYSSETGLLGFLQFLLVIFIPLSAGKIRIVLIDGKTYKYHCVAAPESFCEKVQGAMSGEKPVQVEWDPLAPGRRGLTLKWLALAIAGGAVVGLVSYYMNTRVPAGKHEVKKQTAEAPTTTKGAPAQTAPKAPDTAGVKPPAEQAAKQAGKDEAPSLTAKEYLYQAQLQKTPIRR